MGKMKINEGFSVEITSSYDRFWRYNMAVTCGCFDDEGKGDDNPRRDFIAAEDVVAPTGSNLQRCPDGYPSQRALSFETVACDYLLMYLYVIPHSLPSERDVEECEPFRLRIVVRRGNAVIVDETRSVNCWSGASVEMRIPKR